MPTYDEVIPDLRHIYLEDSYVLGIHEVEDALLFDMLVVLTDEHPLYQPPLEDELYCYRAARLRFSGNLNIEWIERNLQARTVDPDGSIDIGQIDGFSVQADSYWIDGEWGEVRINCDQVQLIFR